MFEHKNKSGIYVIINKINNKKYVGKTKNFYKRYYQYVSDYRNDGKRLNHYLYSSFVKYGFENFTFEVLEFCSIEDCSERETYWIDHFDTTNPNKGYNLRRDSSTGMTVSVLTKCKISERLKNEWSRGMRDGHSSKLKKSWESRDKQKQSLLLKNILSKYIYDLYYDDGIISVDYEQLKSLGLKNVLSTFHRKKSDDVYFKGLRITRRLLSEGET